MIEKITNGFIIIIIYNDLGCHRILLFARAVEFSQDRGNWSFADKDW